MTVLNVPGGMHVPKQEVVYDINTAIRLLALGFWKKGK